MLGTLSVEVNQVLRHRKSEANECHHPPARCHVQEHHLATGRLASVDCEPSSGRQHIGLVSVFRVPRLLVHSAPAGYHERLAKAFESYCSMDMHVRTSNRGDPRFDRRLCDPFT